MVDQLSIYNGALRECKSRALSSVNENRKARYLLDQIWGDGGVTNGGIKSCLEDTDWTFANRRVLMNFDPEYVQEFGYTYRFTRPPDWIKTSGLYEDERGNVPLTRVRPEGPFLFSDLNIIYMDYVSNDLMYGLNLAEWPDYFNEMVELYFAMKIVGDLTKSSNLVKEVTEKYEHAASKARSMSAMEQPTKFMPQGSFVRARGGSWPGYGRSRSNGC